MQTGPYPEGLFLRQHGLFLLLSFLLQLVVAHCDDGQDQVDQVERAEEDDDEEEEYVPRPGGAQDALVEVLPEVLSHQPEGGEEGPAERVEARVAEVGVGAEALQAHVVLRAGAGAGGVATQHRVDALGQDVVVGVVRAVLRPRIVL